MVCICHIVRVDKDESGGNEGVVSGLVESVHALVQVVLKQHEVNHNEASHGSSEPEDGQQQKIQKLQCRGVEFRNAKRHAFSKVFKKDISRVLRYKLGHLVCRRSGIFTKEDGILLQKNINSNV